MPITFKGDRWSAYFLAHPEARIKFNLKQVVAVLEKHGATYVKAEFYGSGDSGSVEGVSCDKPEALKQLVTIWEAGGVWTVNGHQQGCTQIEMSVEEAFEKYADDWATNCGTDWWNNEGGYGHCELLKDHGTGQWRIDNQAYYYTQESHLGDFEETLL